jgi:hypothetical protein
MAAFDSIASVLSVAPQAVNLHLGSRHPFLWRIGAIEKVGVRSLDFTLEPRAQLAKIAARFLPEDPTSAPSPGLVPEANAPCRCAYFSNGRLHPSRETERACRPRSAGDREGLVQPYQPASNFQLYCESWQVVPGVASGCTRVFLPAPVLATGVRHRSPATQTGSPRSARRKLLAALSRCTAQTSATPPLQPSGCSASNTNIPAHRSQRSPFPRTPAWVV